MKIFALLRTTSNNQTTIVETHTSLDEAHIRRNILALHETGDAEYMIQNTTLITN